MASSAYKCYDYDCDMYTGSRRNGQLFSRLCKRQLRARSNYEARKEAEGPTAFEPAVLGVPVGRRRLDIIKVSSDPSECGAVDRALSPLPFGPSQFDLTYAFLLLVRQSALTDCYASTLASFYIT